MIINLFPVYSTIVITLIYVSRVIVSSILISWKHLEITNNNVVRKKDFHEVETQVQNDV